MLISLGMFVLFDKGNIFALVHPWHVRTLEMPSWLPQLFSAEARVLPAAATRRSFWRYLESHVLGLFDYRNGNSQSNRAV